MLYVINFCLKSQLLRAPQINAPPRLRLVVTAFMLFTTSVISFISCNFYLIRRILLTTLLNYITFSIFSHWLTLTIQFQTTSATFPLLLAPTNLSEPGLPPPASVWPATVSQYYSYSSPLTKPSSACFLFIFFKIILANCSIFSFGYGSFSLSVYLSFEYF